VRRQLVAGQERACIDQIGRLYVSCQGIQIRHSKFAIPVLAWLARVAAAQGHNIGHSH